MAVTIELRNVKRETGGLSQFVNPFFPNFHFNIIFLIKFYYYYYIIAIIITIIFLIKFNNIIIID